MAEGLNWTPTIDRIDTRAFQMGRIGGYQLGPPRRDTRFGRVLPAVHEHFKSLVEIELLERLPQAAMHDLEGAFMLQLAHALGLEHRHVATIIGAGLYEGVAYVVQPLILGQTFAALAERAPDEATGVLPLVMHAVVQAAEFLLEAGPLPAACALGGFDARDILLGYDGSVYVTGYGMARFRSEGKNPRSEDMQSALRMLESLDPSVYQLVVDADGLDDMQTRLRKNFREELGERGALVGRALRRAFADEVASDIDVFGIGVVH